MNHKKAERLRLVFFLRFDKLIPKLTCYSPKSTKQQGSYFQLKFYRLDLVLHIYHLEFERHL